MAKSETIHLRVEPETKKNVDALLAQLGMTTTEAVKIFFNQMLLNGGLPFEIKVPNYNSNLAAAIAEAETVSKTGPFYSSAKEAFGAINDEI